MVGVTGLERASLAFKASRPMGELVGGATAGSAPFFCPEQPVFDSGRSHGFPQFRHAGHEPVPGATLPGLARARATVRRIYPTEGNQGCALESPAIGIAFGKS